MGGGRAKGRASPKFAGEREEKMGDREGKDSPPPKTDKKNRKFREKMGGGEAKSRVSPKIFGQIDRKMGDSRTKDLVPPMMNGSEEISCILGLAFLK